ncbi:MAG: aminoacetone oxidase family FAD-binding enzyme, partial [Lachnospiraceae bacterium]|nr:aminoacetone oxidase family FAD-binding enzyme [Lachnospiraceae bacterium]
MFEKNEKCGKKLYITGKGRCNLTNACEMEDLFNNVCSNSKFLYSSFYGFTNQDVIAFFEENGTKTKVERGERVFPLSDHSSDVIAGLKRKLETLGVHICLETEVEKIEERDGKFQAIVLKGGQRKTGDACIV